MSIVPAMIVSPWFTDGTITSYLQRRGGKRVMIAQECPGDRLLFKQLFAAQKTPLYVDRHATNGCYPVHDHDFLEMAVIGGGYGTHETVLGRQQLAAGDVLVLRPGTWHAYLDCRQLDVYDCCVGMSLLERELRWMRDDPPLQYLLWTGPLSLEQRGVMIIHLSMTALQDCHRYLDALHERQLAASPHAKAEQLGYLLLLLGTLTNAMGPEYRQASQRVVRTHDAVVDGIRLLEENSAHPWTISELAEQLSLSPPYLVRLFKAGTGLPPLAYLARYRAERAAVLLLGTDRPIAEIGETVGWTDPNYFARRFRAFFKLSATEYRAAFVSATPYRAVRWE